MTSTQLLLTSENLGSNEDIKKQSLFKAELYLWELDFFFFFFPPFLETFLILLSGGFIGWSNSAPLCLTLVKGCPVPPSPFLVCKD